MRIIARLIWIRKQSLTNRLLDNLTLGVVLDKDDKFDKSSNGRTIKKLAKSQKNIKNLAKCKGLQNSAKFEKLIRRLVEFKISKEPKFLDSTARLACT